MLKLLHISDIHIGTKLNFLQEKAPKHREKIWQNLNKALNYATEQKVDAIIITGDIFDHYHPKQENVKRFKNAIIPILEQNIYIFILPGNHDRLEKGSVWDDFEIKDIGNNQNKLIIFKQNNINYKYIAPLNLKIYAAPIFTQKSKISPIKNIQSIINQNKDQKTEYSIVLAHGSISLKNTSANNYPIEKQEIENLNNFGINYLGLGDWHGKLNVSQGNTQAWYPGSLEFIDQNQINSGYALEITIDNNNTKITEKKISDLTLLKKEINLDHIPLDKLHHELTKLSDQNTIANIKLIGNLKLKDIEKINLDNLEQIFENKFYFLKIQNNVDLEIKQKDLEQYPQNSIPYEFIKLVNEKLEKKQINEKLAQEIIQLGMKTIHKKN